MKYDIFISYRRDGGFDTAQHLYNLLERDGYKVSFDIDTLRNGDFDQSLYARIDQCKDFILIVDAHAFDRTLDPNFKPQNDWLRQELAYALKRKKNIIPVFLAGVKGFPDNLPDDIAAVTKKNGPECLKGHFNVFYEDLKKRFFVTPPPPRLRIKLAVAIIVALAAASLIYIYRPYDKVNVPLSYLDDWEDDVHVEIPAMFSMDISSEVDDDSNTDVKLCYYAAPSEKYLTTLVEEEYDSYSPEDLGLSDDDELEKMLNMLKSAGPRQFDELYTTMVKHLVPDARLNSSSSYVTDNSMEWRVYNFSGDDKEMFYAVFRVPDYGNVIYSMIMPVSWVPLSHLRNKYIFETTLDRVAKAYILSAMEE